MAAKKPTPRDKEKDEQLIFLRKLVGYHEATISTHQARIVELEAQSKQMADLLKASALKMTQLEQEKEATSRRNPIMELLPSHGQQIRRGGS